MIKVTDLKRLFVATGAAVIAGGAMAGEVVINDKAPIELCKEDPAFCDIFNKGTLYKNENAGLIQKVQLVGRYHGQYHDSSLDFSGGAPGNVSVGNRYWEHRRARLGAKVKFANGWEFYNEWNVGGIASSGEQLGSGDFFNSLDVMGFKGKLGGLSLNIGKQKAKITREWSTSSKQILTFERSHIVNEVIASTGKPWGITGSFETGGIKHTLGAWLAESDRSPDGGGRFPDMETRGAWSYQAETALSNNTDLHFDYMGVANTSGAFTADERLEASPYNHVFALGTESSWDLGHCDREFGLVTDLIYGVDRQGRGGNDDFGRGLNDMPTGEDTFGVVIMPHYDLTERLQLVAKYSYASNSRLHRPQRRAFDRGPGNFTDGARPNLSDVHTAYIGLNYRICGDNLKLMAGYEYLTADVYEAAGATNGTVTGDTWMLGIRTYF